MRKQGRRRKNRAKWIALLLMLSLTAAPAGWAYAAPEEQGEESESSKVSESESDNIVPDEILVVYDDAGVSEKKSAQIQENVQETLAESEIEVKEEITESNEYQGTVVSAEIPEDMSVEDAVEQAMEAEDVSYAQPNFRYSLMDDVGVETEAVSVNDKYVKEGQTYYLEQTKTTEAWSLAKSNRNVTVAVLDSGCRLNHADLRNNVLKSYAYDSFYGKPLTASSTAYGGDLYVGHGTHVAGLIAAEANNKVGIAGTSYNANILPVKVFGKSGDDATTETILRGIEYVRQLIESGKVKNLHVMNMSFGYYPSYRSGTVDRMFEDSIEIMADYYDVLSVCAGGNGDEKGNPITRPSYPSDFDACLSVASLTQDKKCSSWSDYNQYKDISAPGEHTKTGLLSTYCDRDDSYAGMNGTSMAAPVVSGICALLWAAKPGLTVDEAVEAVERTATPVSDQPGESGSHGAIDAAAAVKYVRNGGDSSSSSGMTDISLNNLVSVRVGEGSEPLSCTYTGGRIKPEVTVTSGGESLKKNRDYTVSYSSNINVGTATVTIKGIGDYKGSVIKTFEITQKDIGSCALSMGSSYVYTGKPIQPLAGVCVSSTNPAKLKKADYRVTYKNNTNAGTATVVVEGIGNCRGSLQKTFAITKADIAKLTVSLGGTLYTYDKKAKKPGITVKNGSVTLSGSDYTAAYSNNVNVGTATVRITGKNNYTGAVSKTFVINPKGTNLSKLTKKSKGFKAKWKKQTAQTSGYQIQYSSYKSFKGAKTKTVGKAKTTSKTISKLKKKKTYYVRIRTYKKVKGKTYYSGWSKAKKVKTR